MPHAVDEVAQVLEQLSQQIRELERRVARLEGQGEAAPHEVQPISALDRPRPPATWRGFPSLETPSGAVSIVGKAVLGIAGAYLLRALSETGSLPKLPILLVAILYSCSWMIWGIRQHSVNRFASITYAATSGLILSPLLWEATVRFQVISPAFAATVLVAFVVLTLAMTWKRDLQVVPWIATLVTVVTAMALIIATRELVPLTAALLVLALATEVGACMGERFTFRAIPAVTADFAVWLLIFIMTSADGIPEGYRAASPSAITTLALSLLVIYAGSVGIRSFLGLQRLSVFEICQAVAAFALAAYGAIRATHNAIMPALGIIFLLLAAICYWGALLRFTGDTHTRNRRTSAAWAVALVLAGSFLTLTANPLMFFFCLAALAAVLLYDRTSKLSLGMHASVYLLAAATVSPLPLFIANAFVGPLPSPPSWRLWVMATTGALAYGFGSRHKEIQPKRRMLWVVPGTLTGFAAAALAVVFAARLLAAPEGITASRLSVVRTVANCALALAFAVLSSRLKRVELGWLAYATLGFGTLKLIFEDLRFGNAASMVISLLFYGLILIVLPRLIRRQSNRSV